ncbi:MAG: sulfatase [Planctomycetaceae bacterium]|nr:sulfatase [Planctomycetaceae bacterium]
MIAIDDQNDWLGCLGGHALAHTPHLDELAKRGSLFLNAHCQAPLCNSSRTSVLLGKRPTTTGIYGLEPWFREVPSLRNEVTMAQEFARHGYHTMATGKVFHFGTDGPRRSEVNRDRPSEFMRRGPSPSIGVVPPMKLIPPTPMGNHPLMDWGTFPHREEDKGDYQVASWVIEQIQQANGEQPFFLAAGFFLPHVPCYVTPPWLDRFPDDDSVLPSIEATDRNDTPRFSWYLHWRLPEPRLAWLHEQGQWKNLVRSYLASSSFVDAQVGRILAALRERGLEDDTIVVVWSDHGFHLGEKLITGKNTLWEDGTRVPLIFAGPGVRAGQLCEQPVELLDLFPSLLELCSLPPRSDLEGLSLVPQLQNANLERLRPAITTHNPGNHGVRSHRYRYIQYADGSEELYDHRHDANEWHNLLHQPAPEEQQALAKIVAEHRHWLPKDQQPPVVGSAHRILTYDPVTDTAVWENSSIDRQAPIPH